MRGAAGEEITTMGARKKKKKRDRKRRPRPLGGLSARSALPEGTVVIDTPAGHKKMSEVLMEFIEPYSEHGDTETRLRNLLSIAALAWNAGLLPERERPGVVDQIVNTAPPEVRSGLRFMVENMIHRKLSQFGSNKRIIAEFTVNFTGRKMNIHVLSSLDED